MAEVYQYKCSTNGCNTVWEAEKGETVCFMCEQESGEVVRQVTEAELAHQAEILAIIENSKESDWVEAEGFECDFCDKLTDTFYEVKVKNRSINGIFSACQSCLEAKGLTPMTDAEIHQHLSQVHF